MLNPVRNLIAVIFWLRGRVGAVLSQCDSYSLYKQLFVARGYNSSIEGSREGYYY
jgi:hypothetical protein